MGAATLAAATPPPAASAVVAAVATVVADAVELRQLPDRSCRLISGLVAWAAQLVLLAVVLTALSIKRHRERPRRAWNVWLLDIAKQACSAGAGHCVGMGIAIVAHMRAPGGSSECGWYFIVYFMDCTLGITLAITFHKLQNGLAKHLSAKRAAGAAGADHEHPWWEHLVEIGNYGEPPNMRRWAIQVASWVICVVSARSIVGIVVVSCIPRLQPITIALDTKFKGHPDVYLFVVMVGIPMTLNVGQAWIQDQVLKWKHRKHSRRDGRDDPSRNGGSENGPPLLGTGNARLAHQLGAAWSELVKPMKQRKEESQNE